MLPAFGLVAEALTTFIFGLYTGVRWTQARSKPTISAVRPAPVLGFGVVLPAFLFLWVTPHGQATVVLSSIIVLFLFYRAFPRLDSAFLLLLPPLSTLSALLVTAATESEALGLFCWELALLLPAEVSLFRRIRHDQGGRRWWIILEFGALNFFVITLALTPRNGGDGPNYVVLGAFVVMSIAFGSLLSARRASTDVSGLLSLGVLHEYRKLIGRLQLLADFGQRHVPAGNLEDPTGSVLFLLQDEIRLSVESLPSLDYLYGAGAVPDETRVPVDVSALFRLVTPLFRRDEMELELRIEEPMTLVAPPPIVLHCLLIVLRNALEHSPTTATSVTARWTAEASRREAVLTLDNSRETGGGPKSPGWGRGLPIARGLARSCRGNLVVWKRPTTYSVELRFPLSKGG